jgi:hypothetical protein
MNLEEVKAKCTDVSIATINLGNEYSLTKEVKWLIEQVEKVEELEKFVKTYYNCFLDSRAKNGVYAPISNNDQFFIYAKANELLGEPNGKRLD